MNAQIRIDDMGNAYLSITHISDGGEDSNAEADAERLFFKKLDQNGGRLHLIPGRDKKLKLLILTGHVKRQTSVTESVILEQGAARAYAEPTPSPLPESEYKAKSKVEESLDNSLSKEDDEDLKIMLEEDHGCLDPK